MEKAKHKANQNNFHYRRWDLHSLRYLDCVRLDQKQIEKGPQTDKYTHSMNTYICFVSMYQTYINK